MLSNNYNAFALVRKLQIIEESVLIYYNKSHLWI